MDEILIRYDSVANIGTLETNQPHAGAWRRISSTAITYNSNSVVDALRIRLPWNQLLNVLREYIPLQRDLLFKFKTDDSSRSPIQTFLKEIKAAADAAKNTSIGFLSEQQISERLDSMGFTKRKLRPFQFRDVSTLLHLSHGANFSVPGAGKTTVTFALHLLACNPSDKMLVVCPKSAFTAWDSVINDCIDLNSWDYSAKFINLGYLNEADLITIYRNNSNKFFYINYEAFVSRRSILEFLISTIPTHLVLDESHRMKAGEFSQRGSTMLGIAHLPKRRDILSGTPMPQGPYDLQAQLNFLWPGGGFASRIQRGESPGTVIRNLFTRTTKEELKLPKVNRHFIKVTMTKEQAALYGIVKSETLRQLSSFRNGHGRNIIKARKSVMRLLQLASNPILALRSIADDIQFREHPLVGALIQNPVSPKIDEVCRIVRHNQSQGKKTVVWTIFTQNIIDLEHRLSDLNPVSLYGDVPTGEKDDQSTREGRIEKFHTQETCWVMVANPAAAGEGISLHTVCHDAVYLDRSYVSTHYLQSLDRIHRLGLADNIETNITIVQIAPPSGLGSIDFSVSRRLGSKIRALEQLLNDIDLNQIALDEEDAPEPVDYSVSEEDIADLIQELEGNIPFDASQGA
jgi:SNF2 family DNA or RNA helicase